MQQVLVLTFKLAFSYVDDQNDENLMEDARSEAESDADFDISSCPKFDIKLKNYHKSRMVISLYAFAQQWTECQYSFFEEYLMERYFLIV